VILKATFKMLSSVVKRVMPKVFSKIVRAFALYRKNPRLLARKIGAKTRRRFFGLPPSRPGTIKLGNVLFPLDAGLGPHSETMYYGDYAPEIALLLEKFLRPGMTFLDVGANVGYFSAFALNLIGIQGRVYSFEPVPAFFARLENVAKLNPQYHLRCNQVALGDKPCTQMISVCGKQNIGWNTMVPGFMDSSAASEVLPVNVQRLDTYLSDESIGGVDLIKIDVEGFELPVLRGAEGFLKNPRNRPPIICEVAPGAYAKLGCSLGELRSFMEQFGYTCYDAFALQPLDLCELSATTDVVFLTV
jgi:FkbM family methyltransferase